MMTRKGPKRATTRARRRKRQQSILQLLTDPDGIVWVTGPPDMSHQAHVFPAMAGHVLDGRGCWCGPRTDVQSDGLLVVLHANVLN
jgi:hypothetical protein